MSPRCKTSSGTCEHGREPTVTVRRSRLAVCAAPCTTHALGGRGRSPLPPSRCSMCSYGEHQLARAVVHVPGGYGAGGHELVADLDAAQVLRDAGRLVGSSPPEADAQHHSAVASWRRRCAVAWQLRHHREQLNNQALSNTLWITAHTGPVATASRVQQVGDSQLIPGARRAVSGDVQVTTRRREHEPSSIEYETPFG